MQIGTPSGLHPMRDLSDLSGSQSVFRAKRIFPLISLDPNRTFTPPPPPPPPPHAPSAAQRRNPPHDPPRSASWRLEVCIVEGLVI